MEIELLAAPGCPHEAHAAGRLRHALDEAGLAGTGFTARTVTGQAEAGRLAGQRT